MPLEDQVTALASKLVERQHTERRLNRYYEGDCPLPPSVVNAKITRAYSMLIGMADAPWGSLIVNSVLDRLEVTGIRTGDSTLDHRLWSEVWQPNRMDLESKLAHNTALVSGRVFALVWPNPDTGKPEISLDTQSQMVIRYEQGSRRRRVMALRAWVEDDQAFATLYRPEGIYKFQGGEGSSVGGQQYIEWEQRTVPGEDWPVHNPFNVVPVVELAVNRRLLHPGSYPHARGEFEHCTSLIDRINLLTFLGLITAHYLGAPLRAVIGDKILRDDDDNVLPPFTIGADQVAQFENPDTKLTQFEAADRSLLSIYHELDQLCSITATPRHYAPLQGGFVNISADAIRASEGALVAKIPNHKACLGEAWEEVIRLAGMMLDNPVIVPETAELRWTDHESRSLAERADAASKLVNILPQTALLEKVLNATAEEIARWTAEKASDSLGLLVKATATPPGVQMPLAVTNGNSAN